MKKLLCLTGFVTLVILLLTISCTNNNELDLYGEYICDTTNITWESSIAEILDKNCVYCHGPELAYPENKPVRHDSYEDELVVVKDGRLFKAVNHLPGIKPMPYQLPKLPECERIKINLWLENGAPEN